MKKVLKHISAFFFSLNTAIWLLILLIAAFLAGAFIMPARPEFQSLHSMTFFRWLLEQPAGATWWLWCSIAILCLLTVNTFLCSIESIVKKTKATGLLLLVSPQIIHAGFLFILLAHLLSSAGASTDYAGMREGMSLGVSGTDVLRVRDIRISADQEGNINHWEVDVEYLVNKQVVRKGTIRPNQPFLSKGLNVNVRDLRAHPYDTVLLQINSDPGAFWALTGGLLFMLGIFTLIALRIKMER